MDLSKLFENEEPGVFVEPGYKRVDCKVALSIEKPIDLTSDKNAISLSQVKPISVQKLKELSDVLTENSIQNTISESARIVVRQIDETFRNVLKKTWYYRISVEGIRYCRRKKSHDQVLLQRRIHILCKKK